MLTRGWQTMKAVKRGVVFFVLATAFLIALSGCTTPPVCGDKVCAAGIEDNPASPAYCPADCQACVDECQTEGEATCVNEHAYQVCGNYDEDACLELSEIIACKQNQACENGECILQSCEDLNGDVCEEGERCEGELLEASDTQTCCSIECVPDKPPEITEFTVTPEAPMVGQNVNVSVTANDDGSVTEIEIQFTGTQDNNTHIECPEEAKTCSGTASITYEEQGVYEIIVQATDSIGQKTQESKEIEVRPASAEITFNTKDTQQNPLSGVSIKLIKDGLTKYRQLIGQCSTDSYGKCKVIEAEFGNYDAEFEKNSYTPRAKQLWVNDFNVSQNIELKPVGNTTEMFFQTNRFVFYDGNGIRHYVDLHNRLRLFSGGNRFSVDGVTYQYTRYNISGNSVLVIHKSYPLTEVARITIPSPGRRTASSIAFEGRNGFVLNYVVSIIVNSDRSAYMWLLFSRLRGEAQYGKEIEFKGSKNASGVTLAHYYLPETEELTPNKLGYRGIIATFQVKEGNSDSVQVLYETRTAQLIRPGAVSNIRGPVIYNHNKWLSKDGKAITYYGSKLQLRSNGRYLQLTIPEEGYSTGSSE